MPPGLLSSVSYHISPLSCSGADQGGFPTWCLWGAMRDFPLCASYNSPGAPTRFSGSGLTSRIQCSLHGGQQADTLQNPGPANGGTVSNRSFSQCWPGAPPPGLHTQPGVLEAAGILTPRGGGSNTSWYLILLPLNQGTWGGAHHPVKAETAASPLLPSSKMEG